MFGLLKALIAVVILFALVFVGLAYLPDETTQKLGVRAAGVFAKGCRGGKMLLDSFKQNIPAGDAQPAPEPAKEEDADG